MAKDERVYDKVVIEFHEQGEIEAKQVELDLPGSGHKVYFVKDSPKNHPMSRAQANELASRTANMLNDREEHWRRAKKKGRTPGASSRPKASRSVTL